MFQSGADQSRTSLSESDKASLVGIQQIASEWPIALLALTCLSRDPVFSHRQFQIQA